MSMLQIGFLFLIFLAVFGVIWALMMRLSGNPLQQRLDMVANSAAASPNRPVSRLASALAKRLSGLAKLSASDKDEEQSLLRIRFMNAGMRGASAPILYFAAKTGFALLFPALSFMYLSLSHSHATGNSLLFYLLSSAAAGYYLPNKVLESLIKRRQREIFESFPDALDLMTVCVEAGLAMDAALMRVADEMKIGSKVLSEELNLVTLELRAGLSKDRALRNLAMRTGVEDVDALVAMLIQAERFGTSIADSLRVQSDQLRTRRRQRAEEAAAKIALKLLFPLIFFIFPSLLVVLMGPAVIQITRVLLPSMGGGN
ncbi:type II secretion system F family protein [Pseudoduganella sp. UC29_106]|uniref:type II secretion system F family protein n=1 Tax=Pseudoduganella sp. UC29_106 TaxID=3374553 RepID=UPI0037567147